MNYEDLSTEAKQVIKAMVQYCLNNDNISGAIAMGMDGGYMQHPFHTELEVRRGFRAELEMFSDTEPNDEILENEAKLEKLPMAQCSHCGEVLERVEDLVYCPNGCIHETYAEFVANAE